MAYLGFPVDFHYEKIKLIIRAEWFGSDHTLSNRIQGSLHGRIQEYLIVVLAVSTFMWFAYVGRFSAINFLLITKPPRKPNCRNGLIRPIRIVHSKMIITASYISLNIKQKEFGLWLYDTRSYYRRNFSHVIAKSFWTPIKPRLSLLICTLSRLKAIESVLGEKFQLWTF